MEKITVQINVDGDIPKIWSYYTKPEHITKWNFFMDDWCCPKVMNDVWVGGQFIAKMEAKDASEGFFFYGTYIDVLFGKRMSYVMSDDRHVFVEFKNNGENNIDIVVKFDPDKEIPSEKQKKDWQSILNNFKKYVEAN